MDSVNPRARGWAPWVPALLVAVLLRVVLLFWWEGANTDGIQRTIDAQRWLQGIAPLFGRYPWPEGNYLFPALAIWVGGDLYWATRIAFTLLSLPLIPVLYHITLKLADVRAATLAAWIAAVLPYLAVYATSGPRSEIGSGLGSLIAVLGFLWWDYGRGTFAGLLLSVAGVVMAESMRFDAVLVGAGLGFLLLLDVVLRADGASRTRRIAGMTAFGVLCLVYPIALGVQWHALYGDALYFLHTAEENSRQFLADGGHARWPTWFWRTYAVLFTPLGMGYILTPVVFLLALLGIWRVRRQWATASLVLLVLIQMAAIARNLMNFTQLPQIRYALPIALLLIPFVGIGVDTIVSWVSPRVSAVRARGMALGALLAGALATEAITGLATVRNLGILSRQLQGSGFVQKDQFATRNAMQVMLASAGQADSVWISPFLESQYAFLSSDYRDGRIGVVLHGIYRADNKNLVYTFPEYQAVLAQTLGRVRYALVSRGAGTQGFSGGVLERDPIGRLLTSDTVTTVHWGGHDLAVRARYGSAVLLERLGATR